MYVWTAQASTIGRKGKDTRSHFMMSLAGRSHSLQCLPSGAYQNEFEAQLKYFFAGREALQPLSDSGSQLKTPAPATQQETRSPETVG